MSAPAYAPVKERPGWPDRLTPVALLLGAHSVLAVLMLKSSMVSTAHAAAVLLGALVLVYSTRRPALYGTLAAAYIVGVEVLWRMTGAKVFWESGKYAVAAVLLIALWRMPRKKPALNALLYLALLMPGAIITLTTLDLADARGRLSFNLSGPLALAVAVMFFVNIRLTAEQFKQVLMAVVTPICGVAAVGIYSTITAEELKFTGESNFVTSGGYGPNQVSSVLGLGVVAALLWLMLARRGVGMRLMLLGIAGVLAAQSAMTFSRGGLYAAAGAIGCGAFFLLREKGVRSRVVTTLPVLVVGLVLVVLPRLDTFTGGALGSRFSDTNLSHRDQLVQSDLRILLEHPVFGAGPGVVRAERGSLAHTEFTRLLSEHGAFGAAALALLLWTTGAAVLGARGNLHRGLSLALFAWSFLYMASNGMRLAAPSFAFGFGMATLVPASVWVLAPPRRMRARVAGDPRA